MWERGGQIEFAAALPITVIYIHTRTELVSCFFSFNSVYIVEINWQYIFLAVFNLASEFCFLCKENGHAADFVTSCLIPLPALPHAPISRSGSPG